MRLEWALVRATLFFFLSFSRLLCPFLLRLSRSLLASLSLSPCVSLALSSRLHRSFLDLLVCIFVSRRVSHCPSIWIVSSLATVQFKLVLVSFVNTVIGIEGERGRDWSYYSVR